MTKTFRLHVLNFKVNMLVSQRAFSTLALPVTPGQCAITNISSNIYGLQNRQIKYSVTNLLLKPQVGRNFRDVRFMCSSKDPPNYRERFPLVDNKENSQSEVKHGSTNNGLENMFKMVKEKSSGFQTMGKHFSESSSSTVSRILPELKLSSSQKETVEREKPEDWNEVLNRWYVKYQDFIGITDLKNAQDRVTELSEGLLDTQSRRRNLQAELEDLQEKLNLNHQRITKAELYSEEHYQLFDQARDMNARLKEVRTEFENCEHMERETFTQLSAAIRDCHERERTQAEQSKYWSIIASIVSAALASVITSVNNWVRIREIKDHVSANNKSLLEGYEKMHEDIVLAVNSGLANVTTPASTNSGLANVTTPAVTKDSESPVVEVQTQQSPEALPSDSISSPLKLTEQDVVLLRKSLEGSLKEQVDTALAKETIALTEMVIPYFDAVFTYLKLILEGNQALANSLGFVENEDTGISALEDKIEGIASSLPDTGISAIEDKIEDIAPSLPEDAVEKQMLNKSYTVEYGYRHIATAMAVGASIGTLATAFFLGSFSGGATD